jgi:hypothetical protein
MNRDIIRKLYYSGKDSGLFVNLVPESPVTNWLKIYGSVQHNLPHGFYLGSTGHDLVLSCESNRSSPIWYAYDYVNKRFPYRTPDLYSVISNSSDEDWPYLEEEPSKFAPKLLKVEEVMAKGPKDISDFIIFNIHLFS